MIDEIKFQYWKWVSKYKQFARRLKFAFGAYDRHMLMVTMFTHNALVNSDPNDTVYVGNVDEVFSLLDLGISDFGYRTPDSCIASIGYAPEKKMWYGWSHRAICGFKVGHKVERGDVGEPEAYDYFGNQRFLPDSEIILQTEEECKKMAEIFAKDVS